MRNINFDVAQAAAAIALAISVEVLPHGNHRRPAWRAGLLAIRGLARHAILTHMVRLVDDQGRVFNSFEQHDWARPTYRSIQDVLLSRTDYTLSDFARHWVELARANLRKQLLAEVREQVWQALALANDSVGATRLESLMEDALWSRPIKLFGVSQKEERLLVLHAIWASDTIDRKVYGLACKLTRNPTVGDYQFVEAHQAEVAARLTETPNFGRLFGRQLRNLRGFHLDFGPALVQDLRTAFLNKTERRNPRNQSWPAMPVATPAVWKWLCQQKSTVVPMLFEMPVVAKVLWAKGVKQAPAVIQKNSYATPEVLAAWCVAYDQKQVKTSDFHQVRLVEDWLRFTKSSVGNKTWAGLVRRSQEWHRAQARERYEARKANRSAESRLQWVSALPSMERGILRAEALVTSEALWEEGDLMCHCVGGYDQMCHGNRVRIFRIFKADTHLATLAIEPAKQSWRVQQLYGPGNTVIPDKDVLAFSEAVARAYARAERKLKKEGVAPEVQPVPSNVTPIFAQENPMTWLDDDVEDRMALAA